MDDKQLRECYTDLLDFEPTKRYCNEKEINIDELRVVIDRGLIVANALGVDPSFYLYVSMILIQSGISGETTHALLHKIMTSDFIDGSAECTGEKLSQIGFEYEFKNGYLDNFRGILTSISRRWNRLSTSIQFEIGAILTNGNLKVVLYNLMYGMAKNNIGMFEVRNLEVLFNKHLKSLSINVSNGELETMRCNTVHCGNNVILSKLAEKNGEETISHLLIEECGELIRSLSKVYFRKDKSYDSMEDLYGELADVHIMISQLTLTDNIDIKRLNDKISEKLLRAKDRVLNENISQG